jgi:hypothetical protein
MTACENEAGIMGSLKRRSRTQTINGCPEGTAVEDWLEAEAEVRYAASFRFGRPERHPHAMSGSCDQAIDEASQESFPASDPPASMHCAIT